MSDDKITPKLTESDAPKPKPAPKAPAKPKPPVTEPIVSPAPEEPNQTSATSVGARPVTAPVAPYAVIGTGDTDPIAYSKARVPGPTEGRKSLTVLHLQRRLAEEGFAEAASAPGGRYETLTTRAVQQYQERIGATATGVLTREQFSELFKDDPNVTVAIDASEDHTV